MVFWLMMLRSLVVIKLSEHITVSIFRMHLYHDMTTVYSSETSYYQNTWCYISEQGNIYLHNTILKMSKLHKKKICYTVTWQRKLYFFLQIFQGSRYRWYIMVSVIVIRINLNKHVLPANTCRHNVKWAAELSGFQKLSYFNIWINYLSTCNI